MSPGSRAGDDRRPRRRPVHRVGDLLPDAARELGLEEQLRWAQAGMAWERLVTAILPAAAGGSRPVRLEPGGTLVIGVAAPMIGQEIRLREDELVEGFRAASHGLQVSRLRVVVGRGIIP